MQKTMADLQPGLGTLSIVGTLTLAKTGTTARTVTFQDAAMTVAGIDYANTWSATQTFATRKLAVADVEASSSAGGSLTTSSAVACMTWGVGVSLTASFPATVTFENQITTEAIVRQVSSVTSAAGTTTLGETDHVVIVTGATTQTVTLPACATGRELRIKNRSTGTVTVNRAGSDTIDGGTVIYLATNDAITLVGNSTDWSIV